MVCYRTLYTHTHTVTRCILLSIYCIGALRPSLTVMDDFSVHKMDDMKDALRRVNSKGAVMAGGLTKVAQVNDRYPHKYIKTQYKAQVRTPH